MNTASSERIGELVRRASRLDEDVRPCYLDRFCPTESRAEVDALVRNLVDADDVGFLEAEVRVIPEPDPLVGQAVDEFVPSEKFVLSEKIGVGGMASVYVAQRLGEVAQTVAVKIAHDGGSLQRERLECESQLLAALKGQGYPYFHGAGRTDDGRACLVMQHVEGEPIDEYCDAMRLDSRDRISLLIDVCDLVSAVHAKGYVHRDLKPNNILVSPDGPTILDFGIASPVSAELSKIPPERDMGTTGYAGPEQVDGSEACPANDQFALAAVLYQLLARRPLPDTWSEVDLTRELGPDLGAVLKRALADSPRRRYHDVGTFATDLRRHLDHQPLEVRSSAPVRVWKLCRRNPVWLGALVLVCACAGVVSFLWIQAVRASARGERLVEHLLDDANRTMTVLIPKLRHSIGIDTETAVVLARDRLETYRRLVAETADASGSYPELWLSFAHALQVVAAVEIAASHHHRGLERLDEAVGIAGQPPVDVPEATFVWYLAHLNRGIHRHTLGHPRDAIEDFDVALTIARDNRLDWETATTYRESPWWEDRDAEIRSRYLPLLGKASSYRATGRAGEARILFEQARGSIARTMELHGGNDTVRLDYAQMMERLGGWALDRGQPGEARECFELGLSEIDDLTSTKRGDAAFVAQQVVLLTGVAQAWDTNGRISDALDANANAVRIATEAKRRDATDSHARDRYATSLVHRALLLGKRGDLDEALDLCGQALAEKIGLSAIDPVYHGWRAGIAHTRVSLGELRFAGADLDGAMSEFEIAETVWVRLVEDYPAVAQCRAGLAHCLERQGMVHKHRDELDMATARFRSSRELWSQLVAQFPDNVDYRLGAAVANRQLGDVHLVGACLDEARAAYRDALNILSELHGGSTEVAAVVTSRARILGKYAVTYSAGEQERTQALDSAVELLTELRREQRIFPSDQLELFEATLIDDVLTARTLEATGRARAIIALRGEAMKLEAGALDRGEMLLEGLERALQARSRLEEARSRLEEAQPGLSSFQRSIMRGSVDRLGNTETALDGLKGVLINEIEEESLVLVRRAREIDLDEPSKNEWFQRAEQLLAELERLGAESARTPELRAALHAERQSGR